MSLFVDFAIGGSILAVACCVTLVVIILKNRKHWGAYRVSLQGLQGLSAVLFGISSIWIAYFLYGIQESQQADAARGRASQQADAALGRASSLTVQLNALALQAKQSINDNVDPTASDRQYACVIYLKYRVLWNARPLSRQSHVIDAEAIGTPPKPDDLPEDRRTHLHDLQIAFDNCAGTHYVQSADNAAEQENETIKRGMRIRDLLFLALDFNELALMEWPALKDSKLNGARDLVKHNVVQNVCSSILYKDDVFALFGALDSAATRPDSQARDFAITFLRDYPNLDPFLRDVCRPIFAAMEKEKTDLDTDQRRRDPEREGPSVRQ